MKTKYEIVCELTEQGKSSKEISEMTGIGLRTVYQYKAAINRSRRMERYKVEKRS